MPKKEIDFQAEVVRPTPRQKEFLDALFSGLFKFILYGGAAGGGKSYILRWAAVMFLIKAYTVHGVKGCIVGLFCEDYPQLQKRQLAKIATEFPRWLGTLSKSQTLGLHYRLNDKFGGGIIFLCNLDEPNKYDSVEFAAIFVDELTKNEEDRFDELRKRLRWPAVLGSKHFPCGGTVGGDGGVRVFCDNPEHRGKPSFLHPFVGATNPGGKGHSWCKRLWLDGDFPKWLAKYAKQFKYIKALASDNPYNPPSYFEELQSLPPLMAKAYAEGDWELFVGQFFSEWRKDIHVCEPFEIPKWWKRRCGFDWGFGVPACNLWAAFSPDGTCYIYDEYYEKGVLAENVGKKLVEQTGDVDIFMKVADPSVKAEKFNGVPIVPIKDQLANGGWIVEEAVNHRKPGWLQVRNYMAWQKDEDEVLVKKPKLQVFSNCKNLIRTIPVQVFAEEGDIEDLDTTVEDHAVDALRYLLMSLPPLTKVPLEAMTPDWQRAVLRASRNEERRRK